MRIKHSLSHLQPYARTPFSRKGFIRLDMNENNYGCAPGVIRALKKIKPEALAMYPEYQSIRQKLAALHRLRPENICVTAGGDEAIRAIMEAFVEMGNEMIIPQPTFSIYATCAAMQRAKIVPVAYAPDFSFPLQEVLCRISAKTRLAVVVSPNNPTGTAIKRGDLEVILKKMTEGLVILDHTYYLFGGGNFSHFVRRFPNILVLHSFSKIYGLAGLRLGYVLGAPESIESIGKVLPPFSVNSLALVAGEMALAAARHARETLMLVKKEMGFIMRKIGQMGITVFPSQASFFLADLGPKCAQILEKLFDEKVLLKGFPKDPRLKSMVRITVGRAEQNRYMLKKLEKIVREINPR